MSNKKGLYFIIIVLLVVIILGGIYYFVNSKVDKNNKNNKPNDTTIEKANPYVGGYKAEIKEYYDSDNNEAYYVYLVLRNDGTYTYGHNTITGGRKVGTYKVNEDTIELHDIISFGSDACYITQGEGIKDRTIIINKKTLELEDDEGRVLKFTYDSNLIETEFEKSWYITNPINGESPEISDVDEYWTDCTNMN